MKRVALLLLLAAAAAAPVWTFEVGFLSVIPDARTGALGGAGVALGDLGANTYYNPAGIAFGPQATATWTHFNWLPGFYPGMSYDHVGVAYCQAEHLGFAANVVYMQYGETDVVDEHGHFWGRYRSHDLVPSFSAACRVLPSLSAGMTLKGIYSLRVPDWVWEVMPELGIEVGDHAFTVAGDAGVQYRPLKELTLGFAVANLGPNLRYDTTPGDFPSAGRSPRLRGDAADSWPGFGSSDGRSVA